ncbi:hypothetical protein D3C84_1067840 [compost metagenome]
MSSVLAVSLIVNVETEGITVALIDRLTPLYVTLTVVMPCPFGVTTPLLETVAAKMFEDVHSAVAVTSITVLL